MTVGVTSHSLWMFGWQLLASPIPLHGWNTTTPVPHWLVLIGSVLGLWFVIGVGVALTDRFLGRVLAE